VRTSYLAKRRERDRCIRWISRQVSYASRKIAKEKEGKKERKKREDCQIIGAKGAIPQTDRVDGLWNNILS